MKKFMLLAALLCAPAEGQGQVVIGTDPDAPTVLQETGWLGQGVTQSFLARGTHLARISFWFYGGQGIGTGEEAETFYSSLWVDTGPKFENATLHRSFLSQASRGRVDVVFAQPILMTEGEVYSFTVYTTNAFGEGCGQCAPTGARPIIPTIEMTTTDAFADGDAGFVVANENERFAGDIRFEAEFTVPEPSSLAILSIGGAALLFVRRRSYRTRNPQSAHT